MTGKRYYQEDLRERGLRRVYWILDLDVVEAMEAEAKARRLGTPKLVEVALEEFLGQKAGETA